MPSESFDLLIAQMSSGDVALARFTEWPSQVFRDSKNELAGFREMFDEMKKVIAQYQADE